jgi:chemotaxis protein CheY-P-specific phosphatase CheC
MKNLSEKEINSAKYIISSGLSKAAQSLSFFMKETINLKETDFSITNRGDVNIKFESDTDKLFVLYTEIKGELNGICYLVFNQNEVDELCKVALPSEITGNADKLKNMQEPLLLEIDNIISASVITQLANHLKQKMYGDVPHLIVMNSSELKETIVKQLEPNNLIIGFQTEFLSSNSNFHPEFYWILEPSFIDSVRKISLEQAN